MLMAKVKIYGIDFRRKKGMKNNDNGNIACDHYNKYPEDIELIKNLGIDSYRLSISWSRLFPKRNWSKIKQVLIFTTGYLINF